jgi:hypothetical protein
MVFNFFLLFKFPFLKKDKSSIGNCCWRLHEAASELFDGLHPQRTITVIAQGFLSLMVTTAP